MAPFRKDRIQKDGLQGLGLMPVRMTCRTKLSSQRKASGNVCLETPWAVSQKRKNPHLVRIYLFDVSQREKMIESRNRGPFLPQIIAIVMLLLALNPDNPYGYYIFLRIVLCAIFAYLASRAFENEVDAWV